MKQTHKHMQERKSIIFAIKREKKVIHSTTAKLLKCFAIGRRSKQKT